MGQLEESLPGCWATSCSIRRNNRVPNPASTSGFFCRCGIASCGSSPTIMSYFHKAWILHEHSESLNLLFFFCAAANGVHRNSLAESGILVFP